MEIDDPMVGSDVEFFVVKRDTGEIVSAEGFIPGTKLEPAKFDPENPWFATQLDNVLAEGNIPPARTAKEFSFYLERLRTHIDGILSGDNLRTEAVGAAMLDAKYLATSNAMTFGCDPSYNAWTDTQEDIEPPGAPIRSAGFHIHVGYKNPSQEVNRAIIRAMDAFVGIPSILVDDGEPAKMRRAFGYGRSGSFRHQKWGVEYRVLSSGMCATRELMEWCFTATETALEAVRKNFDGIAVNDVNSETIQGIINGHKRADAIRFVKAFRIGLPVSYRII